MRKLLLITSALCLLTSYIVFGQYTKLLDFNGANGKYPIGDLISDGTFLYGMAQYGGTIGIGNIFRIKPDGTGDTLLLNFTGASNGSYPNGSLDRKSVV